MTRRSNLQQRKLTPQMMEKEKEQFKKFLENLQQLSINISFIEALEQVLKYAKFMKDLLSKKERMEETSRITLNERCFAILLKEIPLKKNDPWSFTIPCIIGKVGIDKALADLGASISLMPYSMFMRLGLGELKPTRMCIELANKSTQYPRGIVENVIVKINKFVFPVDFVVLDMEEDHKISIILGRPFFATAHAMIDVFKKNKSFKVGNKMVTFDIEESMKFASPEDDTRLFIDMVYLTILDHTQEILPSDPLDSFLFEPIMNYQQDKDDEADQGADTGVFSSQDDGGLVDFGKPTLFTANTKEPERLIPKLKELPSHLEYAFLDDNQELPVADIKGINPSFCTHKIPMEDNFKPIVQSQHRLNPKVQDVVKAEIVKLRDAGLIYAISDSPWVSPIHVVPKKGGMTVITNENIELVPTKTVTGWRMRGNKPSLKVGKMSFHGKEGIILGHKISKSGIEVDGAKVDVIVKLPYPTNVKGVRSFLGHAGFYRSKQDAKPRLIRWVLLLQEFTIEIKDIKGTKNLAADHLSKLENMELKKLNEEAIRGSFPDEHLMAVHVREPEADPCCKEFLSIVIWGRSKDIMVPTLLPERAGNISSRNQMSLTNILVSEVFDIWGFDFMGTFPSSRNNKYILVAIDYVSKLVEAVALPTNDARVVVKFLQKLFSRFGVPKALTSDRGIHSCNSLLEKTLKKYGVTHRLATPYHPQTSGQTENTNRAIKRILERTVNNNRKKWANKFDDALWGFRTAYKSPIGSTPFRIVYGKACHLPIEIEHKAYWAMRNVNLDLDAAGKQRFLQLNELVELRNKACEHSRAYKDKTKHWHDAKIIDKEFHEGEEVLVFNSRLKLFPRKLKIRWYGPYTVSKVFPYETIEVYGKNGVSFKVNGHGLKKYYGGDIHAVDEDLHFALTAKKLNLRSSRLIIMWGNEVAQEALNEDSSLTSIFSSLEQYLGESLVLILLTDASALGSYTPPTPTMSGKRRFSEFPAQSASSVKEQPHSTYRHHTAKRMSWYGSCTISFIC
ncbi:reverse transcriptase domain-containing protein [Tanacetum coccineum]